MSRRTTALLSWEIPMSMATAARAPASPASRQIAFTIVDPANVPIEGATLAFFIDGVAYGSVNPSRRGAVILVPLDTGEIEVRASYGEFQQTVTVPVDQPVHVFTFPRLLLKSFAPSGARCPDGTTGQPCVDCVINGKPIRICATA